jgi:hypothetical protein
VAADVYAKRHWTREKELERRKSSDGEGKRRPRAPFFKR